MSEEQHDKMEHVMNRAKLNLGSRGSTMELRKWSQIDNKLSSTLCEGCHGPLSLELAPCYFDNLPYFVAIVLIWISRGLQWDDLAYKGLLSNAQQ